MTKQADALNLPPPSPVKAKKAGTVPKVYWGLFFAVSCGLLFVLASGISPALKTAGDAGCRAMEPELVEMKAPGLKFEDLEGNTVSISDPGAFVVLNFWATWCEPCLDEWPDLDRLADRVGAREDIQVWAVSIDEDRDAVRRFLREHRLDESRVRVLFDPTQKAHQSFGSEKIPDTYFVTPQGLVTSKFVNIRPWGKPEAQRCVEAFANH